MTKPNQQPILDKVQKIIQNIFFYEKLLSTSIFVSARQSLGFIYIV